MLHFLQLPKENFNVAFQIYGFPSIHFLSHFSHMFSRYVLKRSNVNNK